MLYYNIKFIYTGVHMHSEHRKRLKGRFLREGLEHFEPHNVLELLLFLFHSAEGYKRDGTSAHAEIRLTARCI